ncbi:hypothetical protein [Aquibium microcysteis]|uniref:hypothetical protein n=1 Tax=Aquibium microcysteis TaxID=675281 RepID=UPI00165CFE16|nr:hypothetical protein [Aquibium microcysteis]
MVNSINSGNGPQVQPRTGGPDRGSLADAVTSAQSLAQLRFSAGNMRDVPLQDGALGGRTAEFVRLLSLGIDALSPGETQQEKASVGARLRLEALDRIALSKEEMAILDEIVTTITGRSGR